jgi:hypothetical protein
VGEYSHGMVGFNSQVRGGFWQHRVPHRLLHGTSHVSQDWQSLVKLVHSFLGLQCGVYTVGVHSAPGAPGVHPGPPGDLGGAALEPRPPLLAHARPQAPPPQGQT